MQGRDDGGNAVFRDGQHFVAGDELEQVSARQPHERQHAQHDHHIAQDVFASAVAALAPLFFGYLQLHGFTSGY